MFKKRQLMLNGKPESLYLQESEEERPFGVWRLANDNKRLSYFRFLAWSPASVYELELPAGTNDLSKYLIISFFFFFIIYLIGLDTDIR